MSAITDELGYTVEEHVKSKRIKELCLQADKFQKFLDLTISFDRHALEFIPFKRFEVARHFIDIFGFELQAELTNGIRNRHFGAFLLNPGVDCLASDECLRFNTAISHLLGLPNFDAMTGTYYAEFAVQAENKSDSYLRDAARMFTLHTDGSYVDEINDWILMHKISEQHACGGESRLLHMDDWEACDDFAVHPLAGIPMRFEAPPSKNVNEAIYAPLFHWHDDRPCLRYIDQFVVPQNMDEAMYVAALSESLESSTACFNISLQPGSMLVLNNHFWLHGRMPFVHDPHLHRVLLRQRGRFHNL